MYLNKYLCIYIYIYIFIFICVCVCVRVYTCIIFTLALQPRNHLLVVNVIHVVVVIVVIHLVKPSQVHRALARQVEMHL